MIITSFEKKYRETKPNKLKTSGKYYVDEPQNTNGWCRCRPKHRIGEWPNNCLSCGSRVRV